jgi:hypothetical protein
MTFLKSGYIPPDIRGAIRLKWLYYVLIYGNSTSACAYTQGAYVIVTRIRLVFAHNSSMQLATPQPRRHKFRMSFRYSNVFRTNSSEIRIATKSPHF